MFARVITGQVGDQGFEKLIELAEKQLPGAQKRPGFQGFYLLTDEKTGKAINISLWATREDMEAVAQGTNSGIHKEGVNETGLTSLQLDTYEVRMQVMPETSSPES